MRWNERVALYDLASNPPLVGQRFGDDLTLSLCFAPRC